MENDEIMELGSILIYQTEKGDTRIDVFFQNDDKSFFSPLFELVRIPYKLKVHLIPRLHKYCGYAWLCFEFGFFGNGMGVYVVLDALNCREDNATLWYTSKLPRYHIKFWDIFNIF